MPPTPGQGYEAMGNTGENERSPFRPLPHCCGRTVPTDVMTLSVVPLTPERYEIWDAFCDRSDMAWYFHTTNWLEYAVSHRPEWSPSSFSFLVMDDHGILAVCPLSLECVPSANGSDVVKEFSLSYGGGFSGPAPALANGLTHDRYHQVLTTALTHVDSLARDNGVARVTFRIFPLAPAFMRSASTPHNFLARYQYLEISLATQVIPLDKDESSLWTDVRRGHRRHISNGSKAVETVVFDGDTISDEAFTAYRVMHHKDAGRVTRPLVTFDMQHRWIREGKAALFGALAKGEWQGFAYVLLYKDGAYYMSGCEDPESKITVPIGHTLQWNIIQWLKQHSYSWYEIGWQFFGPQLHNLPTAKEVTISNFKRRFGGQTVPLFTGEKFYSKDYFLQVTERRVNEFYS